MVWVSSSSEDNDEAPSPSHCISRYRVEQPPVCSSSSLQQINTVSFDSKVHGALAKRRTCHYFDLATLFNGPTINNTRCAQLNYDTIYCCCSTFLGTYTLALNLLVHVQKEQQSLYKLHPVRFRRVIIQVGIKFRRKLHLLSWLSD